MYMLTEFNVIGSGGGGRCDRRSNSCSRPSGWSIRIVMPNTTTASVTRNTRRIQIRLGWIVRDMRYRSGLGHNTVRGHITERNT